MNTATRTNPLSYLTDQLNELKAKGTHFKLRVLDDEQAAVCTFDGQKVIHLASNNYLGLTTHPKLREAALEATRRFGVGSGAVRTIAGTMKIHMELEEKIARFKNVEACVVFQSGFAANAGTVSAVLGKDDFIISDALNHASIIDGARLSKAKILVFRHKDIAHAEEHLASIKTEPAKNHESAQKNRPSRNPTSNANRRRPAKLHSPQSSSATASSPSTSPASSSKKASWAQASPSRQSLKAKPASARS